MYIFLAGLAAWRYAFFITDDSLTQPLKNKLLKKLQDKAFRKPLNKKKKPSLWILGSDKADELFNCIYCLTFWTALALYLTKTFEFIIIIGAIWAIATIIGVAHNIIISSQTDDKSEDEEVE